jgi:predicted transport protein
MHLPEQPVDTSYTLESHLGHMQFDIRGIFERLRKRILNLDASIKEEIRKRSLVYTGTSSFVSIEPQRRKLVLTLDAKLNEIDDAQGTVKALLEGASRASNGNIEIHITALDQIEDTLYLIKQAFERQTEEMYT